jgi:hypothetical protein
MMIPAHTARTIIVTPCHIGPPEANGYAVQQAASIDRMSRCIIESSKQLAVYGNFI